MSIYMSMPGIVADYLLVGGGGAGGRGFCCGGGGGGGGGGVVYRENANIASGSYNIKIGAGGVRGCCGNPFGCSVLILKGGDSCFGSITAYGGGGGGAMVDARCGQIGGEGGSSGGGSGCCCIYCCVAGGKRVIGQGMPGHYSYGSRSGGGGGGYAQGGRCDSYYGPGGCGLNSDISGTSYRYASGGNGGGCCCSSGICGGGGTGRCCCPGCNATTYGSGGGGGSWGGTYRKGGDGCQGVFILRYPSGCGYNVTGGTKYECNGYCIHCFTSDGTLTIN